MLQTQAEQHEEELLLLPVQISRFLRAVFIVGHVRTGSVRLEQLMIGRQLLYFKFDFAQPYRIGKQNLGEMLIVYWL